MLHKLSVVHYDWQWWTKLNLERVFSSSTKSDFNTYLVYRRECRRFQPQRRKVKSNKTLQISLTAWDLVLARRSIARNWETLKIYFRRLDDGTQITMKQEHKYIASFCENKNLDHKYIYEILLASGQRPWLGSGMTTFQLHPSGHTIKPELFYVLEGTSTLAKEQCFPDP